MKYAAYKNAYFFSYTTAGLILLFWFARGFNHSLLIPVLFLALALWVGALFEWQLPRMRSGIVILYPIYLLGILTVGKFFIYSQFLGILLYQLKEKPRQVLTARLVWVWVTLRLVPVFLACNTVYLKLGGRPFHSLSEVPWLPFIGLVLTMAVLDYVSQNVGVSLLEGKPPWKPIMPPVYFLDLPFSPLAIPIFIFYDDYGWQSLLALSIPWFGGMWLARQFLQEASQKKESVELLNVANELISSTLNLQEMMGKVSERIMKLFEASGVEIFLKDADGWRTSWTIGDSPWTAGKLVPRSLGDLLESTNGIPTIFSDIHGNPKFSPYERIKLFSALLIPLPAPGEMPGCILCSSSVPSHFQEDLQKQFATVLSGQISSALLGARLHEKLAETLEELKKTEAQLVHSEKMAGLGKLVSGVAHELNNPLNFLTMQIPHLEEKVSQTGEMLEIYQGYENALPAVDRELLASLKEKLEIHSSRDAYRKIFDGLKEGAGRARQIVDNLRTFARTETDEKGWDYSWDYVDIKGALDSTLLILSPMHKGRIRIHEDCETLPKLWCNPSQLSQVLMNLLSNSFEAIEGDGDVWIEAKGMNGSAIINIRDSGKGIPEQLQKRIFEPFFTTKEVGKGTGLGLSIVYGIMKRHNGEIEVKSAPGEGTAFRLVFPMNHGGVTEPGGAN